MAKATVTCTALMVEYADGQQALTVQLDLDCEICGPQRIVLAGHHLRTLRNALIDVIDRHPDLTGQDAPVRDQWEQVIPGGDPTTN